VTKQIKTGENVFGLHIGEGWYGMWGYGNPTAKAVLKYTAGGKTTTVVTDGSWSAGNSPVLMDSEYNGVTYDANQETEGWDTADCASCASWKPVAAGGAAAPKLANTSLSSASFAAVSVMHKFTAKWMREPSPGVYVFDFTQNIAGWVKLKITGSKNTTVTLRHAEALMHPPYGPRDGNIYVGNLRSAKATDTYILKGDQDGEEFQPVFTQHGFRYVEVTITGTDDPIPPTLDMLEAINIRSGMEQTGTAAFSDLMLNQVQHNILWGQADNLMMVRILIG
jgi:alpha-L-rhamnosidase